MRLPNLLAIRAGRLTTFFLLYVTEGIPLGFTATAVATQMRREGLGPAVIGAFVGALYLPWAWKWLVGPVVDVVAWQRFGRRRSWIVAMQLLMACVLLAMMLVDFTAELKLFTALVLLLNAFAATQDVAIDALACGVLRDDERGLANGLMFGGAYAGQALGGAGVLFLADRLGFGSTFIFVAGGVLAVTVFAILFLREPAMPPIEADARRLAHVDREIVQYARDALRAFWGTRRARAALVFALLPGGAYALSLPLQSNLAVELGLDDSQVGLLALVSSLVSAVCCVLGGWLSDRWGRRRMLAIYMIGTTLPTVALAGTMYQCGWVLPIDPTMADRPVPPWLLLGTFWGASVGFSVFQGLSYGTRTALFMDIARPEVAATQFTAYMAVMNLVIWYSSTWQGWSSESLGYPGTLLLDALLGLVCLVPLAWMGPERQ